jgi:phospholipid transport system substrate-binding protein
MWSHRVLKNPVTPMPAPLARRLLFSLLCGIVLPAVAADSSASDDPQMLVHDTIEALRTTVIRDKELIDGDANRALVIVDRIVSPHVNTTRAGRLILGKHWRAATPTQRQQFIDNFKRLLLRTYAIQATNYTNVEVDYLPSMPVGQDGKEVVVRTRVNQPGKPTADVHYRMARTDAGWKVYDVVANGVSIVVSFRSAVDAEINQYGIDGLISRLAEKVQRPIAK